MWLTMVLTQLDPLLGGPYFRALFLGESRVQDAVLGKYCMFCCLIPGAIQVIVEGEIAPLVEERVSMLEEDRSLKQVV